MAKSIDTLSDELEGALRAEASEVLTLQEASRVSGFAVDTLGRMIREGGLENVGRKHAPRIRQADLPYKPSPLRHAAPSTSLSRTKAAIARAIAESGEDSL